MNNRGVKIPHPIKRFDCFIVPVLNFVYWFYFYLTLLKTAFLIVVVVANIVVADPSILCCGLWSEALEVSFDTL